MFDIDCGWLVAEKENMSGTATSLAECPGAAKQDLPFRNWLLFLDCACQWSPGGRGCYCRKHTIRGERFIVNVCPLFSDSSLIGFWGKRQLRRQTDTGDSLKYMHTCKPRRKRVETNPHKSLGQCQKTWRIIWISQSSPGREEKKRAKSEKIIANRIVFS